MTAPSDGGRMKNKILLSVKLPATRDVYDFWVPADMTLHDATVLIGELLEAREGDRFSASETTALMAQESGDLLDHNLTLESLGFVNGIRLVLV